MISHMRPKVPSAMSRIAAKMPTPAIRAPKPGQPGATSTATNEASHTVAMNSPRPGSPRANADQAPAAPSANDRPRRQLEPRIAPPPTNPSVDYDRIDESRSRRAAEPRRALRPGRAGSGG